MKKLLFTLSCIFFIGTETLVGKTWWDTNNFGYDYEDDDAIDYAALKRIIVQEMDHIFEPLKQKTVNRTYINELKEFAKKELCKTVKQSCSTHSQAKRLVVSLTEEFAINVVVEWAAYIARDLLKNPPVNPAYFNQRKIIKSIKHIIRSQAQLALREKDRRLTKMVQNLVENVEVLIAQELSDLLDW